MATYIIDVNAHCWPFIKTPPYIRSPSLEDFIPPCSPWPDPPPATLLTLRLVLFLSFSSSSSFLLLLHRRCRLRQPSMCVSLDLLLRQASHPFLWWKRTSPPLDSLASWSSSSFLFVILLLVILLLLLLLHFLPFYELISSRELTHASSFRSGAFERSSLPVPGVPPLCQLAFCSPSSFFRPFALPSQFSPCPPPSLPTTSLIERECLRFSGPRSSKRGRYCYRIDASPVGRVGRGR